MRNIVNFELKAECILVHIKLKDGAMTNSGNSNSPKYKLLKRQTPEFFSPGNPELQQILAIALDLS